MSMDGAKRRRQGVQDVSAATCKAELAVEEELEALRKRVQRLEVELAEERARNAADGTHASKRKDGENSPAKEENGNAYYSAPHIMKLKEKAMDVLKEGITISDFLQPEQPLIYANEGFCRITGYSLDETIGRNCRFLQGNGTTQESVREIRESVNAGKSCAVELVNYRKDGTEFVNYLSLTPIFGANGQVTHYVGIQSDITELVNRKKAEMNAKQMAAEAEAATEAKSKFLANMSHEIRTPLNGMLAVSQLMADSQLTPFQRDLVDTLKSSGETLLALVTDILDFSRIEANKLELRDAEFELSSIIEAAVEISGYRAAQKRINVAYIVADEVPPIVRGDMNRLQQVLLNVVNNAVKFTEKGEVILEVWSNPIAAPIAAPLVPGVVKKPRQETSGSTSHSSGSNASWVEVHFKVTDTGIGISPEGLKQLFHSFSQVDSSPTRRFGGTGLGLAISQKLCEAMGGHMWAESQGLGKGSVFHFTIVAQVGRCSGMRKALSAVSLDSKNVLLIEKNSVVRAILSKAMKCWNLNVFAVGSEEDAVRWLEGQPLGDSNGCEAIHKYCSELLQGHYGEDDLGRVVDVLVTDSLGSKLVSAFDTHLNSRPRVVLKPWPEQHELNGVAVLSREVTGQQRFGHCVSVSKPVKLSRLRLALMEVLGIQRNVGSSSEDDEPVLPKVEQDTGTEPSKSSSGKNGRHTTRRRRVPKHKPSKLNILLVEDNKINAKVASMVLHRLGHTVHHVENGSDALDFLRKEPNGPSNFDAVLMDLHMPKMGGFEATSAIRTLWPDVPVPIVALTADAFEDTRKRCLSAGFTAWLAKPFKVEALEEVLRHPDILAEEVGSVRPPSL